MCYGFLLILFLKTFEGLIHVNGDDQKVDLYIINFIYVVFRLDCKPGLVTDSGDG